LSQTKTDYLLDTSVLLEILDQNAGMQPHLTAANDLYISAVALGELCYGAQNSAHPSQGIADVDALAQTMGLLPVDGITAHVYGVIKRELRSKGQMIPDNDIWIAATARQYDLTLATRDAHFSRVAGLQVEMW
jgi:tRNA(fMet)-specific endonuclease VapC